MSLFFLENSLVKVEENNCSQLDGGVWGLMWDKFFSQCTWLGVTKNVFFNNYVVNKSSGSVSYVQVLPDLLP